MLPVSEPLLADKPWHVIPRPPQQVPDPRYGFHMEVPEHLYSLGELHNLAVSRGTLTAADRPYKKGKSLSECIAILAGFRDRHHIDPDLFELFLRSGVYRTYAETFLRPEQIDDVDIEPYLTKADNPFT